MKYKYTLFLVFLMPMWSHAECSEEAVVAESSATASTYQNLRNSENSLRFQSAKMLRRGEEELKRCTSGCKAVFRSIPTKRLPGDHPDCAALDAKTKESPLMFPTLTFSSAAELSSWYSDFSQGKGKEGKELYARCPGDCSPAYTTYIRTEGGKLSVVPEVHCGLPRDKDDNTYQLSVLIRKGCGS